MAIKLSRDKAILAINPNAQFDILNETIECIDKNQIQQAREKLNNVNISLSYVIQKISDGNDFEGIAKINSRNELTS